MLSYASLRRVFFLCGVSAIPIVVGYFLQKEIEAIFFWLLSVKIRERKFSWL
jgi:hypothetical protein